MQSDEGRSEFTTLEPERAGELAIARLRRHWVEGNDELGRLALGRLIPEPLTIYDTGGSPLFYDFEVGDDEGAIGLLRAAALPVLGTQLVSTQTGSRGWEPRAAIEAAEAAVQKEYAGASVTGAQLVCYCYPKIGVQVRFDLPERPGAQVIIDVSDGLPVVTMGADELEGSTAYSYLDVVVRPSSQRRSLRWSRLEEDLEIVRRATPELFEIDRGLTLEVRTSLFDRLIGEFAYVFWPFSSQRILRFGPRCSPHECFELYAQQTNVYCAVATGQMILDFYRWHYTQDQIAAAMGTGPGGTSQAGQETGYESLSQNCLEATFDGSANWAEAKAEIDANRPLKSGIPGHARAVGGWMRTWSWASLSYDLSLKVYDPWPWNADICAGGAVVWEDWDAVNHTNFMYVRHRTTPC